jgi:hypothetical protein
VYFLLSFVIKFPSLKLTNVVVVLEVPTFVLIAPSNIDSIKVPDSLSKTSVTGFINL